MSSFLSVNNTARTSESVRTVRGMAVTFPCDRARKDYRKISLSKCESLDIVQSLHQCLFGKTFIKIDIRRASRGSMCLKIYDFQKFYVSISSSSCGPRSTSLNGFVVRLLVGGVLAVIFGVS